MRSSKIKLGSFITAKGDKLKVGSWMSGIIRSGRFMEGMLTSEESKQFRSMLMAEESDIVWEGQEESSSWNV